MGTSKIKSSEVFFLTTSLCESGECKDSGLLEYDAVSLGDWFPKFLRHCSFETSGNTHRMTASYPKSSVLTHMAVRT
jgi:hypothetical protein